jgi:hypothetical protein
MIRGFGHVKRAIYEKYLKRLSEPHQELTCLKQPINQGGRLPDTSEACKPLEALLAPMTPRSTK